MILCLSACSKNGDRFFFNQNIMWHVECNKCNTNLCHLVNETNNTNLSRYLSVSVSVLVPWIILPAVFAGTDAKVSQTLPKNVNYFFFQYHNIRLIYFRLLGILFNVGIYYCCCIEKKRSIFTIIYLSVLFSLRPEHSTSRSLYGCCKR